MPLHFFGVIFDVPVLLVVQFWFNNVLVLDVIGISQVNQTKKLLKNKGPNRLNCNLKKSISRLVFLCKKLSNIF
jgi:hypothetical protein